MVCDSAEDLPCCGEGHSHASGGGKKPSDTQPGHTHMVTSTLRSVVLQTEMLTHTLDALKAWFSQHHVTWGCASYFPTLKLGHSPICKHCAEDPSWLHGQAFAARQNSSPLPGQASTMCVCLQARASRLSFADILKRLAALPNTDPIFISKQVSAVYWSSRQAKNPFLLSAQVWLARSAFGTAN